MANNWNIPSTLEKEIRQRDKVCVFIVALNLLQQKFLKNCCKLGTYY